MKKQEVYTPLFETDDSDVEKVVCKHCGGTVKNTLINQDGVCIECVMNNEINSNNDYSHPNKKVFESFFLQYQQYLKTKPKSNGKNILIGAAGAAFGLLGAAVVSAATNSQAPNNPNLKFDCINKKIKPSTFDKCNKTTVSIRDETWICPCCNNDNFGAHFCNVCGVYPKFKLER